MNQTKLKSTLKYWREIVFVVSIGLLLFEIAKWTLLSLTIDAWDIFVMSVMTSLFICLIGQFFWKNKTLAIILSVILNIGAVLIILMALYGIYNSPSYRSESIAMLIIGIILVIITFKMPAKYDLNKTK